MFTPFRRAPRRRPLIAAFALAAAALLLPPTAQAAPVKVGNVYTETNDFGANQVVVFDRLSDGTLVEASRVNTGGVGAPSPFRCGLPPVVPPCVIIDSQGSVSITRSGSLLFAVNTGSNTISSFRVTRDGLRLVDRVNSGGTYPVSLDNHGRLLYVLNQGSGDIAGFRFTLGGHMTAIPGSRQPLVTRGSSGQPEQVGFDKSGETLTVTESATRTIETFQVTDGAAGPAIPHVATAEGPFGFAFDNLGHLVVSDAGLPPFPAGDLSTYSETTTGDLIARDTKATGGRAPCWVVVTPDGRFAFVANLLTKSISRFRIGVDGGLTLLGVTASPNVTPFTLAQNSTDEAVSRDGRFLYALVTGSYGGDIGRVDAYRIGPFGDLTFLASTPMNLPAGASGLAAR